MIVNNRPKKNLGHCGGCVQRRGGFAGLQRYGAHYVNQVQQVPQAQGGFGNYEGFNGAWEDWCAANYPPSKDKLLSDQCLQWSICGGPDTPLGQSCRGLPSGSGNVGTDILGSFVAAARPALASEYEPLSLYRCQLYDPARFVFLSAISGAFPPAIAKGSLLYMSVFTISPQMFIPKVGGFWLALDQATQIGGADYASAQVIDALINKIPQFIGFVVDFFFTAGVIGAFVKKGIQMHALNMPPGDGKSFMTAIYQHYGSWADAIRDPTTWKRSTIYSSIGDAVRAGNFSPDLNAMGDSLVLFANAIADCINGNFGNLPNDILPPLFDYTTVATLGHPTLKPRAQDMLVNSRKAILAALSVVETIGVLGIGNAIKAAADQIQAAFDTQLAAFSAGKPVPIPPGTVITSPPPPKPKPPVGSNLVVAPAPPAPAPPPAPGASVAPKKSIWAPIGVGAGTGFVAGGPIGALGGAGVAMIITTLKKGS